MEQYATPRGTNDVYGTDGAIETDKEVLANEAAKGLCFELVVPADRVALVDWKCEKSAGLSTAIS